MAKSVILLIFSSVYFYSKAKETEEPSERDKPLIEKLAEFYVNSAFFGETKVELDRLSEVQKKKRSGAIKEITYATSFCHQLRWISKRSFKNLLGNPQASIAQVTWQILLIVLWKFMWALDSDIIYFMIMVIFYPPFHLFIPTLFGI